MAVWGESLQAFPSVSPPTSSRLITSGKYYQISEYKCPARTYPSHNYTKFSGTVDGFTWGQLLKCGENQSRGSRVRGI